MHDIDLATENGRGALELTAKEKATDLSGLELMISQLSNQACSRSDAGGHLNQIKSFNDFLERVAEALEAR